MGILKNGFLRFETLKGLNSPKIETRPPKLFCCFVLQSNKMPLLSQTFYKQKVEKKLEYWFLEQVYQMHQCIDQFP